MLAQEHTARAGMRALHHRQARYSRYHLGPVPEVQSEAPLFSVAWSMVTWPAMSHLMAPLQLTKRFARTVDDVDRSHIMRDPPTGAKCFGKVFRKSTSTNMNEPRREKTRVRSTDYRIQGRAWTQSIWNLKCHCSLSPYPRTLDSEPP